MATVLVKGIMFRASHVNNVVSASLAPYKHAPRVDRWMGPYVQKWAEKRVSELPELYHKRHKAMYLNEDHQTSETLEQFVERRVRELLECFHGDAIEARHFVTDLMQDTQVHRAALLQAFNQIISDKGAA
jgi:hypothetical protein